MTTEVVKADTYLSYSSMKTLQGCERRYDHYKLRGTKYDSDYERSTAFEVGTLFHSMLEFFLHHPMYLEASKRQVLWERMNIIAEIEKVTDRDDMCLAIAMMLRYLLVHKMSKLQFVAAEIELKDEGIFLGFVDVILLDTLTKKWWISDLKTAAKMSELTVARLPNDMQLNLYAYYRDQIAEKLKLDPNKFAGCRYRITTKTKTMRKDGFDDGQYVDALLAAKTRPRDGTEPEYSIRSYDIEIPIKAMNPTACYEKFMDAYNISMLLRDKKRESKQNFANCDTYMKPCEYWSQCHGCEYSKAMSLLKINTESSFKNDEDLAL